MAVALAKGATPPLAAPTPQPAEFAAVEKLAHGMAATQRAVRALFTGGTFCYEAQLAFLERGLPCRSNAPAHGAGKFDGHFEGNVFLDLGDDDYTRGRPHPMIDPSLRNEAIRAQGGDASTAVLLFDVVLGYGSHEDPARDLAIALQDAAAQARKQGRSLALIGHVCGTDGDPQNRARQVEQVQAVGATLAASNVEAALLAAHLIARRG
jgi:FdrA protein